MTLNGRRYEAGTSGYRPGTLNVQVNGIQIEDLYQEWAARTREVKELREKYVRAKQQLTEQGKLIKELKDRLFQAEN